jgi:hypothetical protein
MKVVTIVIVDITHRKITIVEVGNTHPVCIFVLFFLFFLRFETLCLLPLSFSLLLRAPPLRVPFLSAAPPTTAAAASGARNRNPNDCNTVVYLL